MLADRVVGVALRAWARETAAVPANLGLVGLRGLWQARRELERLGLAGVELAMP